MSQSFHHRLPNRVEDEVWDVFTLPPAEQSARVAILCRQDPEHASMIRRLVLMIEQSGVAHGPLLSRRETAGFIGDPRGRFGHRAEECRLVAEFLWRILERVSADVAVGKNSDAVSRAAQVVLEVDLRDRPAAATLLHELLAGSPWLPS